MSDPIVAGHDLRQIAAYGAVTQEIFRRGIVGFRFDYYNPNADFADDRRGQLIPADAAIRTFSPVVGLILNAHLRVLFQYDAIVDRLARDERGVPVDLDNDQWTFRVQGDF